MSKKLDEIEERWKRDEVSLDDVTYLLRIAWAAEALVAEIPHLHLSRSVYEALKPQEGAA